MRVDQDIDIKHTMNEMGAKIFVGVKVQGGKGHKLVQTAIKSNKEASRLYAELLSLADDI